MSGGPGARAARPGYGEDFGARLSFDRGAPGRRAVDVPAREGEAAPLPDAGLLRGSLLFAVTEATPPAHVDALIAALAAIGASA